MSYTPQYQDNTQLYNATISSTGPITGIDTTGANSIIAQFSGTWVATLIFEGSNDNTEWFTLISTDLDTLQINETITSVGFIGLKVSSKYIRVNVLNLTSGTIPTIILGKTSIGVNAADIIALAMDKSNNSPLYIEDINGINKRDGNKALIPSDAPTPIVISLTGLGQSYVIDTIGYQSLSFQIFGTFSATPVVQISQDNVNYTSGFATDLSAVTNPTQNANLFAANWAMPTPVRYVKFLLSAYTSGNVQILAYLRQQPFAAPQSTVLTDLRYLNGVVTVNAGLGGTLAIGGTGSQGQIPGGANPIVVAGVDSGTLVRRLLTDTSGRVATNINTAAIDTLGTARALNVLQPASNPYNLSPLLTQDVGTFEGMSIVELLGSIWKEMKLANWYLSQASEQDEPNVFRNDFENSLAN